MITYTAFIVLAALFAALIAAVTTHLVHEEKLRAVKEDYLDALHSEINVYYAKGWLDGQIEETDERHHAQTKNAATVVMNLTPSY